jgi:hypothetical protein
MVWGSQDETNYDIPYMPHNGVYTCTYIVAKPRGACISEISPGIHEVA